MSINLNYFLWALLFYSLYCYVLFLLQRRIIFPRDYIESPPEPANHIPGIETFWVDTSFGKVEAWFLPPEKNNSALPIPVMIFAHANAELIDYCPHEFIPMTKWGMGVLMVEFPGYGRSQGKPSQKTISEAYLKAYDSLLLRKNVDPNRIVLFGRSLGGGVVCDLAAQRPSGALILISTYTSVRSFAKRFLAPGFLIRDPFDNLSVVSNYEGSILIIHGRHDDMIPFSHGVTLNKNAQNGILIAYNCAHNDCPPDYSVYLNDIRMFLLNNDILQSPDA